MSDIVKAIDGYEFRSAHGKCSECEAVGFHTKNIDYFGARTIYDFRGGCEFMRNRNNTSICNDGARLIVDTEAHEHVAHCKICQHFGY